MSLPDPIIETLPYKPNSAYAGLTELQSCAASEPLTKRERFTMAAMQGLMSMCKNPKVTTRELAEDSVAIADALTSALKSIPEPE